MAKKPRKVRPRPVADVAEDAGDELGPEGPRVSRFSKEEEADAGFAAGVQAAGESDRPAGSHAAPEYPVDEPRSEINTDRVFTTEPERPEEPEPTARPRERREDEGE
jgi:hypothetical protein